jgi:hypothetical protein
MSDLVVLNGSDDLTEIAEAWDRLRSKQLLYCPDFESLAYLLGEADKNFLILALKDGDHIFSLACFIYARKRKLFTLGERKLFSLPIKEVSLFGSTVLGTVNKDIVDKFLYVLKATFRFDLLYFGYIPRSSELYAVIHTKRPSLFVTSPSRKSSIKWLINLPKTFDDYLAGMSSSSRQSIKRKLRKVEQELKWDVRVISSTQQIEPFLRDAEAISRLTYQWNVGDRLCDDEATRRLYTHRAQSGRLRCYIAYASGRPCAFLRGELAGATYHYETPGFDPKYSKFSPGLALLMYVIRDLIEQTDCKTFDFGAGGDAIGYKSKLGNFSVDCRDVEMGNWSNPYSVSIFALQEGLNLLKNIANRLFGEYKIGRRLKKAIRRYGDR